jgi:hypothetical protein
MNRSDRKRGEIAAARSDNNHKRMPDGRNYHDVVALGRLVAPSV